VRNTVLAIVAVLLLLVAGFIIYRATRLPVALVSPEEMKMLTQPGGPASPVGGGAGRGVGWSFESGVGQLGRASCPPRNF
jgi:hypothetical protein